MSAHKQKRKRRRIRPQVYLVPAILLAAAGFGLWKLWQPAPSEEGITYLTALREQDAEKILTAFQERNRQEFLEDAASGKADVFSQFADTMFLGDSRTLGFTENGFVPASRNLGENGEIIQDISRHLGAIESAKPAVVNLNYGLNDIVQVATGLTSDEWIRNYEEQVRNILAVSGNSQIVINSIIEPMPVFYDSYPTAQYYPEFNEKLEEMCRKNGWTYINNDELGYTAQGDKHFQEDGYHFLGSFYPLWAANMIEQHYGLNQETAA